MTDMHSIAQPFEAEVSPANNRQLTVRVMTPTY